MPATPEGAAWLVAVGSHVLVVRDVRPELDRRADDHERGAAVLREVEPALAVGVRLPDGGRRERGVAVVGFLERGGIVARPGRVADLEAAADGELRRLVAVAPLEQD
jgi:hypothetical protein